MFQVCVSVRSILFFQAEDGIRDRTVTGVQTCALPILLVVGAIYYMLFTGVPGTATYYATIMTIYTWVAKGAWFALGYPYDFVVTPVWIRSEERRVGKEC